MKSGFDIKELKEIEKSILKGINLKSNFQEIKTIAGFDIAYSGKNYIAAAVVVDLESKREIEKRIVTGEEIMPYSPSLAVFREGPAIIDAYRSLEIKPDVLIVKGNGALKENKVGLASYVGVLINKPCIGVTKDLMFGRLDEDKILVEDKIKGIAIKTKQFANPIYISPGHNIDLEMSVNIVKQLIIEPYKLPLVLHLAHKYANKGKKGNKED
ncbi:endonuclease V [Candidatus Woesearchaeota archaeon]|nr:endonuclease V [Candidatus Woesearchaeota archaeon]